MKQVLPMLRNPVGVKAADDLDRPVSLVIETLLCKSDYPVAWIWVLTLPEPTGWLLSKRCFKILR